MFIVVLTGKRAKEPLRIPYPNCLASAKEFLFVPVTAFKIAKFAQCPTTPPPETRGDGAADMPIPIAMSSDHKGTGITKLDIKEYDQ